MSEQPRPLGTDETDFTVSPEFKSAQFKNLPGASAETAISLTEAQLADLDTASQITRAKEIGSMFRSPEQNELANQEIQADSVLIEAAKKLLDARHADFPDHKAEDAPMRLWIRTEEPQRVKYEDIDYNTWQVWIGPRKYGEQTAVKYFRHPDGRIEEVYRWKPIRH